MPETFTVQQNLKLKEFLNAAYYITFRLKIIRRIILFLFIASCVGVALDLIAGNNFTWSSLLSNISTPVIVAILFSVFIGIASILLMTFRPNNFKNITYVFTNWGMEKTEKAINFSRQWNKFLKYKETKHFIFLFISESDAHIMQKKMFKSEAEIKEFVLFLDERFKPGVI